MAEKKQKAPRRHYVVHVKGTFTDRWSWRDEPKDVDGYIRASYAMPSNDLTTARTWTSQSNAIAAGLDFMSRFEKGCEIKVIPMRMQIDPDVPVYDVGQADLDAEQRRYDERREKDRKQRERYEQSWRDGLDESLEAWHKRYKASDLAVMASMALRGLFSKEEKRSPVFQGQYVNVEMAGENMHVMGRGIKTQGIFNKVMNPTDPNFAKCKEIVDGNDPPAKKERALMEFLDTTIKPLDIRNMIA